jgi:hypothetical protein
VEEYWLFDPKGEWIPEKLRGYRLQGEEYVPITDSISQRLNLRLVVEDTLIGFYRLDTGEKLLIPDELSAALSPGAPTPGSIGSGTSALSATVW